MEDMLRIAKTSVSNRLKRMLANPPVREGKQISKSRCMRASRGWMKAAMHKVRLRERNKKRRLEQEARRVETGIHDDDDEIKQAWKRQRKSSEAFGRHDDGTMREGAGAQQAEPAYKAKMKTSMQRRKQMKRAKTHEEDELRARAIEGSRKKDNWSHPSIMEASSKCMARPQHDSRVKAESRPMPRSQPDSGSRWQDRAGRDSEQWQHTEEHCSQADSGSRWQDRTGRDNDRWWQSKDAGRNLHLVAVGKTERVTLAQRHQTRLRGK